MDARERSSRRHGTSQPPRSRISSSLPVRTASHTTPPSQPHPNYPLPVPKEKEERALELYIQYCNSKLIEQVETSQIDTQSTASHRGGYHLAVPRPPTAHSVTSSSRFTANTSAYGALTGSVVSFDGNDESTSAAVTREGELISFDGRKVKPRRRNKLSPVTKAKAALVRHLVSCWVCRSRRVQCPLEHHDIDVLERLRQQRFVAPRPKPKNHSCSSISSSSQKTATSVHAWPNTGPGFSQADILIGFGAGLEGDLKATLGNLDPSELDIQMDMQPPGAAAYGSLSLNIPLSTSRSFFAPVMPGLDLESYSTYSDGQMFVLGSQRNGYFHCSYLGEPCLDSFDTDEELQRHFEMTHFNFNRINPARRFVCLSCMHFNNDIVGPCSNCQSMGQIELWICGNFIRDQTYLRHAPHALSIANWTPTTEFPCTYRTDNIDQWDHDLNSGSFDGYINTNTDNYDYQGGGGNYGGGSQQHEYRPSNHSSYSTSHFQGNRFNVASQLGISSCKYTHFSTRNLIQYPKTQVHQPHFFQRHKRSLFLFLVLLAIVVFSFSLSLKHVLIHTYTRRALLHLASQFLRHLQLVGFLGIVGIIVMGLSLRTLGRLREWEMPSYAVSTECFYFGFSERCGRSASAGLVLGGGFS